MGSVSGLPLSSTSSSGSSSLLSRKSGERAPLAAFFTAPHSALRICARLHRRILEQHRRSPAGRNDSVGGRIYPGESCRLAVGTHGGRNGGLFPGGQLCLLAVPS